jgi:hypothetical protein
VQEDLAALEQLKKEYKEQFENIDCTHIVLKMGDLLESIQTPEQWDALQSLLYNYNAYRDTLGKPIAKYYVVNRDDYPKFNNADEFHNVLRYAHDKLAI